MPPVRSRSRNGSRPDSAGFKPAFLPSSPPGVESPPARRLSTARRTDYQRRVQRVLPAGPALAVALLLAIPSVQAAPAGIFTVPGKDATLTRLEELHRLHRVLGPDTTLWDPWLPGSLLWLATTNAPSSETVRSTYRQRLLNRRIDPEGYVSSQQHEGLAHGEGWPFPLWTQAGGVGWHFTLAEVPYGSGFGVHLTTNVTAWTVTGATPVRLAPDQGWTLRADAPSVTLTSPPFRVDARVAPFLRVLWKGRDLGPGASGWLEWLLDGESEFPSDRRWHLSLPDGEVAMNDVNLPVSRHPQWSGTLVRLRLRLEGVAPLSELTLRRLFTAIDSRHSINNAVYLQACDDYVRWTGDLEFLRRNLQRMRLALAWAIHEFRIAEENAVLTPWVGHDGRSGHDLDATGRRTLRPGVGVGGNYWDLLPFGGHDALATVYYFDALRRMAALERQIERHPEWNLPLGPLRFEPAELLELAESLRQAGNERFWSEATGRFVGWIDTEGRAYDYGFTFLNNEAIHFAFASEPHARRIREWIDGVRIVSGDTSTGADIYHWRFGPRATTRRNVETYFWGWSDPGSIAWGGQVQDGGAVLGFSFHDLMARLEVNGPDDAARRLDEIAAWFGEVQNAGGYRRYYADPSRGTLQGGGTAGGLGLDHEFFESLLVPQVILHGFLGFQPRLDGCWIAPRLPSSWPSLTVRGIRLHDVTLDVTADSQRLRLTVHGQPARPLRLVTPGTASSRVDIQDGVIEVATPPPAR